jgi:hypothetical protein
MSESNKNLAKQAGRHLREARRYGREAKKIFENIGDPDGIKKSDAVEKTANDAVEYVESRVGDKS